MRFLEITAFLALSGALHAATLVVAPLATGGSTDRSGTAEVTLQAATPTLAAMVQTWDRPPEIGDAPVLVRPETVSPPDRPAQDAPPKPQTQTIALAAPSPAPDLPNAETRLPAPFAPLAETTPDTLGTPTVPPIAPPRLPDTHATARPMTPQQPSAIPDTPFAPQVDTSPPVSHTAPIASLRPELRPDRPVPPAASRPKAAQGTARTAPDTQGTGPAQTAKPAPATKAAPRGPSTAQLVRLEQTWGAEITLALRRAHRPPRGVQGTVTLVISIAPSGQVAAVSLAASSGNRRLDQAALAAAKRARFPRAPDGLTKSTYRFSQRLTVAR